MNEWKKLLLTEFNQNMGVDFDGVLEVVLGEHQNTAFDLKLWLVGDDDAAKY